MGAVNEGLCASVAKPFVCKVGGLFFLEKPPEVKEQSRWQFCSINIIIRFQVLKTDFCVLYAKINNSINKSSQRP
jgi:hypothetical protein